MKKRILLSLAAVAAIAAGVIGMSAFEAHVINVTAKIENALTVPVEAEGLSFGTVFPEEVLYKNFGMSLSGSFLAEDRVDDVEYILRQKPKCGVPIADTDPVAYSQFAQVTEDENGIFHCPMVKDDTGADVQSVMLPLLCPYLSKTELDSSGAPTANAIAAFHGPLTNWTMEDTIATQLAGRLSKADKKTSATWQLDLHAPCFQGMCAQDNVIPADYEADPAYEHQMFGCDLWIEVTGISLPNEPICGDGAVNQTSEQCDDGNASDLDACLNSCLLNVCGDGFLNSPTEQCDDGNTDDTDACQNDCTLPPVLTCGDGIVNQTSEQCDGSDMGIYDPAHYSCDTSCLAIYNPWCGDGITNGTEQCDDANTTPLDGCGNNCTLDARLTVNKIMLNNDGGNNAAGDFQLYVNGVAVNSGQTYWYTPGAFTVSEIGVSGYDGRFLQTQDCDTDGDVILAGGDNKTCTLTNDDIRPNITLIKSVINNNSGILGSGDFTMRLDGTLLSSGTSRSVDANIPHTITEDAKTGYHFHSITGNAKCPTVLGGTATLNEGEAIVCTIENDDD